MDHVFAALGRKQLTLEAQDNAYTELLKLSAGLVSGEIDRSRVLIDLSNRTWTLAPDGARPTIPATINGVPLVVTAPADPGVKS